MKKYMWLIVIPFFLCCKGRKLSLSGNDKVGIDDFIGSFETVKTPYQITDSVFMKDENDSSLISYPIFTQFVADTVIRKHFPKGVKPDLYPVAKIKTDKKESYLFCDAVTDEKEILYLLCFDKSNKFVAAKVLFAYDDNPDNSAFASVDNKYTISITHQQRSEQGELLYRKDAYVLNDAGAFTLILTESNDAAAKTIAVINPIDTLSRKHKFSGDYVADKKNFISVRDGKNASTILFFVHFEKDNSSCNGELKGEAKFISATTAQFHGNSDPCTINFSFSNNKIFMKEIEGCGNHRDIKCFFDGSFFKKKEAVKTKPKAVKKKVKN
jgi:hypothetical protein